MHLKNNLKKCLEFPVLSPNIEKVHLALIFQVYFNHFKMFFFKEFQSFEFELPYKIEEKLTQSESIRNYLSFSGWDYK